MGKVKTQGTEMFALAASVSPDVLLLGCITGIDGLGGAANKIDASCFSSVEMEYEGGLNDPSQITVSGIYDSTDEAFLELVELKRSKEVIGWYIGGNDGTDPPTLDSTAVAPPTTRTGIDFRGYVADITWQMAKNDLWKYQLMIQRSGEWNITQKAP